MDWESLFSFLGSALGCIAGILAAQKMTNFRLESLENKMNKHNEVIERTYKIEEHMKAQDSEIKEIKSTQDELWSFHVKKG
ncbi:MAG: hypothetical protein J6A60_02145 [Clostridia bacterium]|nr:hypothetical protein [Clostridia bacterium]